MCMARCLPHTPLRFPLADANSSSSSSYCRSLSSSYIPKDWSSYTFVERTLRFRELRWPRRASRGSQRKRTSLRWGLQAQCQMRNMITLVAVGLTNGYVHHDDICDSLQTSAKDIGSSPDARLAPHSGSQTGQRHNRKSRRTDCGALYETVDHPYANGQRLYLAVAYIKDKKKDPIG
jgi:hypothetical protein